MAGAAQGRQPVQNTVGRHRDRIPDRHHAGHTGRHARMGCDRRRDGHRTSCGRELAIQKDPVRPDGSETILKPGQSGGQTDSTTTQPNRQPDKAATQPNNQTTTQPAGHDYWQAGLDATNAITTAKARQGGYDRERQFGGWTPNGCGSATTRDTILERDMTDVKKNAKCQVVSGTLADPLHGAGPSASHAARRPARPCR